MYNSVIHSNQCHWPNKREPDRENCNVLNPTRRGPTKITSPFEEISSSGSSLPLYFVISMFLGRGMMTCKGGTSEHLPLHCALPKTAKRAQGLAHKVGPTFHESVCEAKPVSKAYYRCISASSTICSLTIGLLHWSTLARQPPSSLLGSLYSKEGLYSHNSEFALLPT
jgi:hypothetical protein